MESRRWLRGGLAFGLMVVAFGASASDEVGRQAARAFERARPSIVAIDYTVSMDAGSIAADAAGVIVRDDGLVMTALDFFPEQVQDSDIADIEVWTMSGDGQRGRVYEGVFLGRDRPARAAFLKIEGAGGETFPAIRFVDGSADLGQQVVLLGVLPENLGRRRYFTLARVTSTFDEPRLQYGLALELMPGALPSPGTPILDLDGRALGVMQNLSVDDDTERGRTLATLWPTANFADALAVPPDPGRASRAPWIGIIGMQDVSRDLAEYWQLPAPGGVVVGYVIPGSPAEEAGLVAEDVILRIGGQPVHTRVGSSVENLIEIVRRQPIGLRLPLLVWNQGEVREVEIPLRERPKEVAQAERFRIEGEFRFTVRELVFIDRFSRDLDIDQGGVVVSFVQPGWAVDGGLQSGDIITRIDAQPIADLAGFEETWKTVVEPRPREIVLTVIRGDTNEVILVRIECLW